MTSAVTVRALLEIGDADALALIDVDEHALSYGTLREQVAALRRQLAARGVGPGDTIAIVLPNGPQMAIAFLAAASCGAAAPLNPAYRAEELRFYLGDLEPSVLITTPEAGVAAREVLPATTIAMALDGDFGRLRLSGDGLDDDAAIGASGADSPPPEPDDVALRLHTSGTTAQPKLVALSQRNITASASGIAAWLELSPSDRCLNVMPLFHIHGLIAAVLASVAAGASLVATPGFDAFRFFPWLDAHQPSWYTAVPTMHQLILGRASRHAEVIERPPLRFIRSSSAGLPPSVFTLLEQTFDAPVVEAYGMTEASHQMSSNPLRGEQRAGTVGLSAGAELRILDADDAVLPEGALGEVAISGPGVTTGYVANPEANASAFVDGWFRTGDQGVIDADGYLTLTGRLKELINRGGEKIAPLEVDDVLLQHPAVAQAVTFARPHEQLGEDVAAEQHWVPGCRGRRRAAVGWRLLRQAFLVGGTNPGRPRTPSSGDSRPRGPRSRPRAGGRAFGGVR